MTGLTNGAQYQFKMQSVNFNGPSEFSDVAVFFSCKDPYGQPNLYFVDSTSDSILLGWNKPIDDGGCPIEGYEIYRDAADDTVPSIGIGENSQLRNNPTLTQINITSIAASLKGQFIKFKIRAYNVEGNTESIESTAFFYAPAPSKPADLVECTGTNTTHICVTMSEQTSLLSLITSYHLEVDDGKSNNFVQLADESKTLDRFVPIPEANLIYRLRYRVRNSIGYSSYSEILSILAASVPDAPPAPMFDSSTDTAISFRFNET